MKYITWVGPAKFCLFLKSVKFTSILNGLASADKLFITALMQKWTICSTVLYCKHKNTRQQINYSHAVISTSFVYAPPMASECCLHSIYAHYKHVILLCNGTHHTVGIICKAQFLQAIKFLIWQ